MRVILLGSRFRAQSLGPDLVAAAPPTLPGLPRAQKSVRLQAFVLHLAVGLLAESILDRLARLDEVPFHVSPDAVVGWSQHCRRFGLRG
jgi:hypothetical protein